MPHIWRALGWAASLLLAALGHRLGLVGDDMMQTMVIVLPIMALMALKGQTACRIARRETRA